ncbi:hypothetical protein BU16DRAFT_533628 [Lophium mytilinum]|uniref:Tautomerase cis-CaaD-like domain-containing protein n=1 Tax=Lophium mytilinum TaxID=390894 RepID=A0A6A6REX9_9PEZI|nr:hypothetical protein BU16DRAFT_533628 [Lophium mytilinum]
MPVYHIYILTLHDNRAATAAFTKNLAKLHADTFGSDPDAVRVMFHPTLNGEVVRAYGGYGMKPAKGLFGVSTIADHMIAYVDFHGSPEVWQQFCRKVQRLYQTPGVHHCGTLESIYLVKLDTEFELGGLISAPPPVVAESSKSAPPAYVEQLKD